MSIVRMFVGSAMLWSSLAYAEPARTIGVEIQLVKATRVDEAWIDPALRDEATDLRSMPYNRFERVGGHEWRAAPGATSQFEIGSGVTVKATVVAITAEGASVTVQLLRGGATITQTTVERPFDRAGVLSAGREGGTALVVPVSVHR
jgi:hypothetical protein